jgi:colicin import membrane protein
MRWLTLLLPLLLWLQAARPADDAERARLAAERQALIDGFAQEELACQQRFFVNACVEDVSRRRREALAPLRARELELDDAERRQRAAERRAAIEAKQREQAARPAPASAPELPPRSPAEPASAWPASPASASQPSSAEAQARAAQAAERARASQRRREEAEAALQRVRRRLAEREAAGKSATPLPVPEAASGPGR